jgi:MFS family permease
VWVDRLDRRLVMIAADVGAGLMTIAMLLLYVTGNLQIWHLYLAEALAGASEAFQIPAYTAATTMLVTPEQYIRTNGMRSLSDWAAKMFAPFCAGIVLRLVGIGGVMLVDVVTFMLAVAILLVVRIPPPPVTRDGLEARGSVRQEMVFGFRYILRRKGLLGLLLIFTGLNLFAALTYFSILPAMVLARSGGDEFSLASVQAMLGIGGVVGGLAVSIWGGPKRRIHAVLIGAALSFLLGDFLFAIGRSAPVWMVAGFVSSFFIPFIVSADRAIWQSKVAPDVQGRVFSAKATLQVATMPLGYLLAGPLADHLFEPAMAVGGSLSGVFGGLVGTGPGAGIGLMFVCTCIMGMTISVCGYFSRAVRRVEDDLPDSETISTPELLEAGVVS